MGLLVKWSPRFVHKSYAVDLLGFHFLIPCLKMLSDVGCFRFSRTNAQVLAPKVDIDSTPKLVVLLCLRSRNWPLLRFWIVLSQSFKILFIIISDLPILTLKISVAKYRRFLVWFVTDLSFSSKWKMLNVCCCMQFVELFLVIYWFCY